MVISSKKKEKQNEKKKFAASCDFFLSSGSTSVGKKNPEFNFILIQQVFKATYFHIELLSKLSVISPVENTIQYSLFFEINFLFRFYLHIYVCLYKIVRVLFYIHVEVSTVWSANSVCKFLLRVRVSKYRLTASEVKENFFPTW